MGIKTLLENIWVGIVKYGRDVLGHGTLKSAASQKWIEESSLFWHADTNSETLKVALIINGHCQD